MNLLEAIDLYRHNVIRLGREEANKVLFATIDLEVVYAVKDCVDDKGELIDSNGSVCTLIMPIEELLDTSHSIPPPLVLNDIDIDEDYDLKRDA